MAGRLRGIITATVASERDRSLDLVCGNLSAEELLAECADLERFRAGTDNLYERVRALFFLYALHRFHLPVRPGMPQEGRVPYSGYGLILRRRFEEAIGTFLDEQAARGPSAAVSSALATAYRDLAFQTLANQVRRSVREVRGNRWLFRTGHPADHPLRIRPELLARATPDTPFPTLREQTPVRMDLSHCAWSDIFFLGMDYPEGARVANISVDLGVWGRDRGTRPPVEAYLRVIDEPVLRLVSVDLGVAADITSLGEVFDFAKDYLGLLKAALIAAGIVPPGLEGSGERLSDLLARVVGPGLGLEVVSSVNDIPKGSRLAVSTNLLASLIAASMRATGQARSLTGPLSEEERRLVAARAILGEWLGGSGGGWQDSGGVWPGIKLIEGSPAQPGDPEFGISRGRLLPRHTILGPDRVSALARGQLQDSLVLVHGGMAQNVGPVLEMVTEKYLLRSPQEWQARQEALRIFDGLLEAFHRADLRAVGEGTTSNFQGPLQTIIPAADNAFTESLISAMQERFGSDFWGFWMLGGMSGGGMGFLVAPGKKAEGQAFLLDAMTASKRHFERALPFAMDPVVYDFAINERGTWAELLQGTKALMPASYYALQAPRWVRQDPARWTSARRAELGQFGAACRDRPELSGMAQVLFDSLFPSERRGAASVEELRGLLLAHGFDPVQHERIRSELRAGRIGLAQNRLPTTTVIEDVRADDLSQADQLPARCARVGEALLREGRVAVVSLAAGAGSRWTRGAGVVKAISPFCRLGGDYRTFLEIHTAKSRRVGRRWGVALPHVVTTSYLTHAATAEHLALRANYGYPGPLYLSPGRAVGLRLVPMQRDLHFAWEELGQQELDEQAQKMRDSLRTALLDWAKHCGEGSDYTDNVPGQCLHPVGHWYEVPNLLRNGVLRDLLAERPSLQHLLVHNIDTLGADVDPALLGFHADSGRCLTFEVIPRQIDDRGGGLARVDGQVCLVEGLAMPREEDEFALSYYNTLTTWVDIDRLLAVFGLSRGDLSDEEKVAIGLRRVANRMPTYVTLKDVKRRWGHGQEDVFPVCQFEKLWGDMSTLPEIGCGFLAVSRLRGQQLKDQAQLDGWIRDGSSAYVESLCEWQ